MRALLVFALAASIGAHWALLQGVAWMGMLSEYSRGQSLSQAVAMTFDGRHPCSLCLAVNEGRRSEQQLPDGSADKSPLKRLDLVCEAAHCGLPPRTQPVLIPVADSAAGANPRAEAPPVPPPRARA